MNLNLWTRVAVELEFKNRVVGGIPKSEKLIESWIATNMPNVAEDERKKLAEKTVKELPEAAEEAATGMWTTFKQDDKGVYIEGRQVKAMFKESANVLRDILIKQGGGEVVEEKAEEPEEAEEDKKDKKKVVAKPRTAAKARNRFTNLKARLAERLFVEDDHIHIRRDGNILSKPDGDEEKPVHVITMQGPRTALKKIDYVNAPATVSFTLRYLNDGVIDTELLNVLLEHSAWNGLGSERSQGNGLFNVKSLKIVKA